MSISVALAAACFAPLAIAHHGFAAHYYPDRYITIEGTVRQFDFINPHAVLHIDGKNEAGEDVVYVCALQARVQLQRRGVSDDLFSVGSPIRVEGFAARRDPYGCEFGTAYFPDGSSFTMRTREGRTIFAMNPAPAREQNATIFGNWIRPTLYGTAGGGTRSTGQDSITPAGEAALAAFDPILGNPVVRCEPGSPVRTWGAPGLASSIQQGDGQITIHHESMDVTRTIHMNMTEHPTDVEPSDMGHSIGRWDGDTLVIESAGFSAGVLNVVGRILHTDAMTLTERLRVLPESGDLEIAWTMIDPVYYAGPVTGAQVLKSTDQELTTYECIPEALPSTL